MLRLGLVLCVWSSEALVAPQKWAWSGEIFGKTGTATQQRAAVVGGGPAGLLSAIALARRGWAVDVFDKGSAPPPPGDAVWGAGERSYQLGINGRGQRALRRFEAMARIDAHAASVRGRLSLADDGATTETRLTPPGQPGAEKSYVTRVMQRDRLQACLLEEVTETYGDAVRVHFDVGCDGVEDVLGPRPTLRLLARV